MKVQVELTPAARAAMLATANDVRDDVRAVGRHLSSLEMTVGLIGVVVVLCVAYVVTRVNVPDA